MKIKNVLLAALTMVSFSMFGHGDPVKIDTEKSTITWLGKKVTGQHSGTIGIKSGELMLHGDKLEGGSFVIDMSTIAVTDLKAGQGKEKLEGHLNSDDFFGVEANPEATLKITRVMGIGNGAFKVLADLTIKGKTQEVSFDATVKDGMAEAEITIDRAKFDVKYGSGSFFDNLGDNMIYDDFVLNVKLAF